MINKLIIAISQKLDSCFDGYRTYTENIIQELSPPAFYIKVLQTGTKQVVANRYHRNYSFDVHFFPIQDGNELAQCHTAAEKLIEALEYITVWDDVDNFLYRGTNINAEIHDKVLHLFVQYNLFTRREVEAEVFMGELSQQGLVKG